MFLLDKMPYRKLFKNCHIFLPKLILLTISYICIFFLVFCATFFVHLMNAQVYIDVDQDISLVGKLNILFLKSEICSYFNKKKSYLCRNKGPISS